jgi:hypothetical protein
MKKYKNIKKFYGGNEYDSKAEAQYAEILDRAMKNGLIKDIKRQVRYSMPNMTGAMRLAYIVDFQVTDHKDRVHYVELKGYLTAANVVKMSYFQHYHQKKVELVRTTGLGAFRIDYLK